MRQSLATLVFVGAFGCSASHGLGDAAMSGADAASRTDGGGQRDGSSDSPDSGRPLPDGGAPSSRSCEWDDDCFSPDRCCREAADEPGYCCSYDYRYERPDGRAVFLCGEGPACPESDYCCAFNHAVFLRDGPERCTDYRELCRAFNDITPPWRPAGELPDGSGEEWGTRLSCVTAADCAYDCCDDPDTGERYCCDHDRVGPRESDGLVGPLCGRGPPCPNDTHCCAEQAARFPLPEGIARCTNNVTFCEWLAMVPYP